MNQVFECLDKLVVKLISNGHEYVELTSVRKNCLKT